MRTILVVATTILISTAQFACCMRVRVPLLIMGLVVLAVALGGLASTTAALDDNLVHECAEPMPDDFAPPDDGNETIGWFDGYWYDEPVDVDVSEGLTEEELEQLSARTAARLEAMRCLPFERMPDIDVIDRETFAEEQAASFEAIDERTRLFDNTQFETLLTIGSDVDSIDVREESRAASVGGYYDFAQEEIVVIVEEEGDAIHLDEAILAHELGHALQDQHFNLSAYDRNTKDRDKGKLGVIEGDVHRIEMAYMERCAEGDWSQPCLTDESESEGGAVDLPSLGHYFMEFQPYSDGPAFIESIYADGGWEAVDDLYTDMPNASMYTIHPEYYGEVEAETLTVEDRSADHWERLELNDSPDYNVIGQAGMSSMLMDQAYGAALDQEDSIIDTSDIFNSNDFNPYNYEYAETDGWRGDELYVYTDEDNRTGSVWKTAWVDGEEMATFLGTYEALAEARGGERVPGYAHTWTFQGTDEYNMSLTLYPDDDRLWIVTAPTYGELTAVNDDIELLEANDREEHGGWFGSDGDGEGNGDTDPTDAIPGFGILAAVAALFALMLRTRWHR